MNELANGPEKPWMAEPACWDAFVRYIDKRDHVVRIAYDSGFANVPARYKDFSAGYLRRARGD